MNKRKGNVPIIKNTNYNCLNKENKVPQQVVSERNVLVGSFFDCFSDGIKNMKRTVDYKIQLIHGILRKMRRKHTRKQATP